jgi:ATP-dependent Clp protease ATP-binding subunit ClpB
VISIADIQQAIEDITRVPLAKLQQSEAQRLLEMEPLIGKSYIGQEMAVKGVSDVIRRNKTDLSDANRPMGSFLFMGPTGAGKTELCKALARFLFDDEAAMTRIDMSEYAEKHNVSRLIGAPPGYVGFEQGGLLVEAVEKKPYQVILLDEIEKAHPDVFNVLLQILDDGRLTSGDGKTADFTHTIIVATTNTGSRQMMDSFKGTNGRLDPSSVAFNRLYANLSRVGQNILEADPRFKPEFINRFDSIIAFHPHMRVHTRRIADLLIGNLNKKLAQGDAHLKVVLDDEAMETIVTMGSDMEKGARPVRRFIQKVIEPVIARGILDGTYSKGQTITFTRSMIEQIRATTTTQSVETLAETTSVSQAA